MKIFKLLIFTTFLLFSQSINFNSEKEHFLYCQANLDDIQNCSNIRAFSFFYLSFYAKYDYGQNVCSMKHYKDTNTCNVYRYTKDFREDLKKFMVQNENNVNSFYYDLIRNLYEDIKKIKK